MAFDIRSTLLAGACLALVATAVPAAAADSDVVARVGPEKITKADLDAATAEIGQQFGKLPQDQQRLAVLSALIDIKALAQEAEKANLQKDPKVAHELQFQRERTLHNAYFAKNGVDGISDADLQKRYEKEIAAMPATEEVHARHILLKSKDEAEKVIKELENGADFEKVAKDEVDRPVRPAGRRPRLLHRRPDGARVLQGGLRAEARRVHQGAGEDAVRLARHQGRGQARGAEARPSTRSRTRSGR